MREFTLLSPLSPEEDILAHNISNILISVQYDDLFCFLSVISEINIKSHET